MPPEPPTRYVVFVEHHLDPLRSAAAGVVGAEGQPDELYPEVLSAVAARWGWLELLRTRLGRAGAADSYLGEAFARQSQRWQRAQLTDDGSDDGKELTAMVVLRPGAPLPPLRLGPHEVPRQAVHGGTPQRRLSSAAVRMAPFLPPESRAAVAPLAEAAVAWWHAYETRRRRRLAAVLGAVAVALLLVIRVSHADEVASGRSGGRPVADRSVTFTLEAQDRPFLLTGERTLTV